LEKIFPPSFFYSMEHLSIHLPYEAKLGGPVQCIHLRGIKLLNAFTQFVLYLFNISNDACLYFF